MNHDYRTNVITLVKNYLNDHPESEDSLSGITEWWVKIQKFDDSKIAVDNALKLLVKQGVIEAIDRNGTTYYKLKNHKI